VGYRCSISLMITDDFPGLHAYGSEGRGRTPAESPLGKIPFLLVPTQYFEILVLLDALEIFGENVDSGIGTYH